MSDYKGCLTSKIDANTSFTKDDFCNIVARIEPKARKAACSVLDIAAYWREAKELHADVVMLSGIVKAASAMPDAHWGYGFPIGSLARCAGGIAARGCRLAHLVAALGAEHGVAAVGQVRPASGERSRRIIETMSALCREMGTTVREEKGAYAIRIEASGGT